jgi:thiamine biosynthesis lipoprotein
MESIRFRAMNSEILLLAQGSPARIADGFEEVRHFIQGSDACFSRFSNESELSRLNCSAGEPFQASPDFFSVLLLARHYFHQTHGLFDPSILPDLLRLGYDRSLDLLRGPGSTPLFDFLPAPQHPSFDQVEFDEARRLVLLPAGMSLDLGGIAKGWIAEQAALILAGFSSACAVNAGGDMFLVGLPEGQEQWLVALEDPLQPEVILTTLHLDPGALATSAVTKRVWQQGDHHRHHLIDPRTGEPAVTGWLSVTVMAAHACQAEVFAKALLIGGPAISAEFSRICTDQFSYLAVDLDRQIIPPQRSLEFAYVH